MLNHIKFCKTYKIKIQFSVLEKIPHEKIRSRSSKLKKQIFYVMALTDTGLCGALRAM